MRRMVLVMAIALVMLSSCQRGPKVSVEGERASKMEISVNSSAFKEGEIIPSKYTCDGANVSPPLSWSGIPDGTKSIALICDDPDAPMGTWVHWVIYNLPRDADGLPEAVPRSETLPNSAKQGTNSGGKIGYDGPCPPSGTHRYYFKVYALDISPNLPPGISKGRLQEETKGHILAEGQLMGRYSRSR